MILNFLQFKKLFEERKKSWPCPTYASVKPDDASMHEIYGLMERIELPGKDRVVPSELHATVCYSKAPIWNPTAIIKTFVPLTAVGDELTVFESRTNKKRVLVLKLAAVRLRALYAAIMKTGASYDFPTFEPHVTLCYDLPEDFEVPQKIEPIKLRFTEFEVKPLDEDWKAT